MKSGGQPAPVRRRWLALAAPSLSDLFFAVMLATAFGRPAAWQQLLADGDVGWHIRTGDLILGTGAVPLRDPFSFSRAGEPWFAWEWLADVIFSLLHGWHGLAAVAGFSACVLCLSAACLFCWLLRREVGLWIAFPIVLAVASASSVHYLARPHIYSLLFFTLMLWLLDEDRRRPGSWVWTLVPLLCLWANLHAGFVAGLAVLGLRVVTAGLEGRAPDVRRYLALSTLCGLATLANPYGWRLHQHIFQYLGSAWIMEHVQEFQSPAIRTEGMMVFVALLLSGVGLVVRSFARRQWFEGALVLVWAFAALRSARHVPLYAVAAAPLVAYELADCWRKAAALGGPRSAVRILWELAQDLGRSRRIGIWTPLFGALVLLIILPRAPLADFPDSRFPVAAVQRNLDRLCSSGKPPRILSSDQWADYLIYRLYPAQRVFFDGRSDFYGPALGNEYYTLLTARHAWPAALARYRFDVALLPVDWPLGSILEHDPGWEVVYRDPVALLLVRRADEAAPGRAVGLACAEAGIPVAAKGNLRNCRM